MNDRRIKLDLNHISAELAIGPGYDFYPNPFFGGVITIPVPKAGKLYCFICLDSTAGATVTGASGVTFDGANDKASFETDGAVLLAMGISSTRAVQIAAVGTVSYS